jgi:DNA-binding LacI/PurR family transcriptional regulator
MPTIADVARHAGVAPSTVSYVLSGKRSISPATCARVERSIEALAYLPHAGARALASRRASVLALVVPIRPEGDLEVMMEFVMAVARTARGFEHDVLLLTNDEGPAGLRRVASTSIVDGVILMEIELRDPRIPVLRELELPTVLIGVPGAPDDLTCVDLDFYAAGRMAVDHLADLGHRSIALIGPHPKVYRRGSGSAARTLRGVKRHAGQRGLALSHHSSDASPRALAGLVEDLFAAGSDITGLIVKNEKGIVPLLDALRAAGVRVPEDVSIVAVAPNAIAERTSPSVTSVDIPFEQMAQRAVGLLIDKLDGADWTGVTLFPPRLTARASSAGVRVRA